jgi:hypothetical protein
VHAPTVGSARHLLTECEAQLQHERWAKSPQTACLCRGCGRAAPGCGGPPRWPPARCRPAAAAAACRRSATWLSAHKSLMSQLDAGNMTSTSLARHDDTLGVGRTTEWKGSHLRGGGCSGSWPRMRMCPRRPTRASNASTRSRPPSSSRETCSILCRVAVDSQHHIAGAYWPTQHM